MISAYVLIPIYIICWILILVVSPVDTPNKVFSKSASSVYYESAVWPVCEMTEDATLGRALELASAQSSDDANYQVVLFQKGTKDTYEAVSYTHLDVYKRQAKMLKTMMLLK